MKEILKSKGTTVPIRRRLVATTNKAEYSGALTPQCIVIDIQEIKHSLSSESALRDALATRYLCRTGPQPLITEL